MAERRRPGVATVAAVVLGMLLLVALLLTPAADDSRGRLTSYSSEPGGARALYELQRRSGWRVERSDAPFGDSLDSRAVYAVLDPPVMVTAGETHRLLQAVRAGAGLLVVIPERGPLADSLGIGRSRVGAMVDRRDEAPDGFCADSLNRRGLIDWPGGRVHSLWLLTRRTPAIVFTRVAVDNSMDGAVVVRGRRSGNVAPTDSAAVGRADTIYRVERVERVDTVRGVVRAPREARTTGATRAAMAGYALGRGRVVAVADPDLLRNDVLRVCRWDAGPTAALALHWLAGAGGRRLVFDEFHQNPDVDAAPMRAVGRALVGEPWGRMILVGVLGAVLLLAAGAARPIAPAAAVTVERRSPLEHVQALARAYAQAGSTRLVARRLARGLRRRNALAAPGGGDDASFLRAVADRHPPLAPDLNLIERAMAEAVPADQLPELGDAVARVDSRLRPDR
ncbi:MAG: DUF4350 domain-containing protein [Gemmatimonadaceae bacterium]